MTDMIDQPKLPPLVFVRAGNYTYARTYTAQWREKGDKSTKQSVKNTTLRVGRINNNTGKGVIDFDRSFIEQHPELVQFVVTRESDEPNHYRLVFTPKDPQKELQHPYEIKYSHIGATLVLDSMLLHDPLVTVLEQTFPDDWREILSFAYYLVICPDGIADHFCRFAEDTLLPSAKEFQPHHLPRLFQRIKHEDIMTFFKDYLKLLTVNKKISTERFWAVDSTSISTYAKLENACCGHNKQGELLPQLNVMLITDEITGRPLFFQLFNGAVTDMTECIETFELLYGLGVHSFVVVADRGFFSKKNLQKIIELGYHFVMCVPYLKASSFQKYADAAMAAMAADLHYDESSRLDMYTCTKKADLDGGVSAWVHVFHDPAAAADEANDYKTQIKEAIKLYKGRKELTPEMTDFINDNFLHDDKGTFQVNEHGEPLINKAVYQTTSNNCGVFMVLSDSVKLTDIALRAFTRRNIIEENFKTLKVRMKLRREHTGSDASLVGKSFIQFVALSIYSMLEAKLSTAKRSEKEGKIDALPHHSVATCLDELNSISQYHIKSKQLIVVSQLSKAQRETLELFGVKPPMTHYEKDAVPANIGGKAPKPHGYDLHKAAKEIVK